MSNDIHQNVGHSGSTPIFKLFHGTPKLYRSLHLCELVAPDRHNKAEGCRDLLQVSSLGAFKAFARATLSVRSNSAKAKTTVLV
jgi:hypothetical protein